MVPAPNATPLGEMRAEFERRFFKGFEVSSFQLAQSHLQPEWQLFVF